MKLAVQQYVLVLAALSCTRDKGPAADSDRTQANGATSAVVRTPPNSHPPSPSTGPASPTTNPPASPSSAANTILFVGTSLTAGYGLEPDSAYPLQIQRFIDADRLPYSVVNAGVSGETSSALLRRVDWLTRQPIALVVIETGANDGLRGIPVETMRSNIEQIIDRIAAARPAARIVLAQMEAPPNLGADYTRRFRAVFPDVAREKKVTLMPFLLQGVAGRRELNQSDGIHPNYDGERIVARNVWQALRPMLH